MANEIMNSITRTFYKVGFELKKHSPEILVGVGITGAVASTIMACRATTKLSAILDNAKQDIDTIHEVVAHPENLPEGAEYTVEDSKKDLAIVYAKTGLEVIKLYAPAAILGTLSIASILASNGIMRQRNLALAAAYATVDKGFKEYRGNVVERFGEAVDRELRYNIKAKEIEEIVIDEEGNETVEKRTVEVADIPARGSGYARFFDDGCKGWTKNSEDNLFTLKQVERWANHTLHSRGYLFLNEVYEALGIPKTKAGQVVGWRYNEEDIASNLIDGYVDFGIYDIHDDRKRDFVNGRERVILIDFNVDGNILEAMKGDFIR